MKKVILLSAALLLLAVAAFAQSSQAIPYQAVARDTTGSPIPNQHMNARMSIYDTSLTTGTALYVETDTFTTSNLGMFTINIGQGTVVSGTFSAINWSTGQKYLKVELDPTGGTSFINMGSSQLLNVPFALYALQSGASSPPTGTPIQVPYFNHSGVMQSDSLFTRDSSYTTHIFRNAAGGVNEGLTLGSTLSNVFPDGVFLTRIDSSASHVDFIGEGNFSNLGLGVPNGIGIACMHAPSTGEPEGLILIVDSDPANTNIIIQSKNPTVTNFAGEEYFDPANVSLGVINSVSGYASAIIIDTVSLHLYAGTDYCTWPTTGGASGQVLTNDGTGNLSWASGVTTSGTSLQVPYYNSSGVLHSDSLFTRDSTYATQILRTTSGGVYEGFSIGHGFSGDATDGAFVTRIDTSESHYDYIGVGNILGSNSIGILCSHGIASVMLSMN